MGQSNSVVLEPRSKPFRWALQLPGDIISLYMIVQSVDSCPYNRCGFCYTYRDYPPHRVLSVDEVKADFESTYKEYKQIGHGAYRLGQRAFICDADPLTRPIGESLEILRYLHSFEPIKDTLKVVATYARADTVFRKKDDLARLRNAGLTDLYMGVESGDDEILRKADKGYTTDVIRKSVTEAKQHGYRIHAFVITGLGGLERTHEHAQSTASLLNELQPDTVIVSPLTLSSITAMGQACQKGEFQELTLEEKITEESRLVNGLDLATTIKLMGCFRCSEIGFSGKLPEDKEKLLKWLQKNANESTHYLSCAPD